MDASSSDTGPPTQYVDSGTIRQVFAESRYFERFQSGEFTFEITDLGPPLRRRGESFPAGYRSQLVRYRERGTGRTVALVHQRAGDQFGNPAPKVWADPKYVYYRGIRHKFSPKA